MRMWQDDPKVLQKVRKSKGLTQSQLAERAGVTRTLIADIELGRRSFEGVREQIWAALAEADSVLRSGKSIGELMTEAFGSKTPEEREAALSAMTEKGRKRFLQVEREATVEALESHLKEKARKTEALEAHIKHLTDPRPLAQRIADLEGRMAEWAKTHLPNPLVPPDSPNSLMSRLLQGEPPARSLEEQLDRMERDHQMTELRQLVREDDREKYVAALQGQIAAKDQEISALRDLLDLKTKEVLLRDKLTVEHKQGVAPEDQ